MNFPRVQHSIAVLYIPAIHVSKTGCLPGVKMRMDNLAITLEKDMVTERNANLQRSVNCLTLIHRSTCSD